MSKFLKFIVHFVVICTILCILALVVPPFFGVTTVIVDDYSKATNLPAGSVTYAIPVKTEEVFMGTPILVQNNGKYYRYNLSSVDLSNHTGGVIDPSVSNSAPICVEVKNYLPRIIITVGYLGYLLMATHSVEGMIILGLAVLFLVILYVIAEIWKRDKLAEQKETAEEAPQDDQLYVKSKKELKREEKAREKRMREEDKELLKQEKARRKEERKNRNIIKTGGFVDEIYEDELEPEETAPKPSANVQAATTEAHELLKKEIAAATAEDASMAFSESPDPAAQEQAGGDVPGQEEVQEPVEIKKMAIPLWTASQLAEKARRDGDAPDIMRDPITNVTLFDYSDIIGVEDSDSAKA